MDPERIGRYELIREIGRGGMATVYLAHDPLLGRDVAIKVLPRQFIQDAQFLERFRREARAVGRIDHESVVRVYDSGEHEGQPYLVMEYLPGGMLTALLGKPIPLAEIVEILTPVAAALDAAHRQGIVHRDLKPGNILFDADGNAHVADFGIAQLGDATQSITGTGIIGTPAYMSPEQCQGDGDVTPASDVYSLGVIAYEMVTGRPPFTANSMPALMRKHIQDTPQRPSTLDPALAPEWDASIMRAPAKEPAQRQRFAADLVSDLPRDAQSTIVFSPKAKAATPPPDATRVVTDSPIVVRLNGDHRRSLGPFAVGPCSWPSEVQRPSVSEYSSQCSCSLAKETRAAELPQRPRRWLRRRAQHRPRQRYRSALQLLQLRPPR